jgi:hypothetical protein
MLYASVLMMLTQNINLNPVSPQKSSHMQLCPDILRVTIYFYFIRHTLPSILLVAGGDYARKSILLTVKHIITILHTQTHKYLPLNRPLSLLNPRTTPHVLLHRRHFTTVSTTALQRSGMTLQPFRGKFQASFLVHKVIPQFHLVL